MEYREHDGFRISEIGVGCYGLSGAYGTKDPEEFKRMIRRAHELGVNFFDTAEAYGDAERILGEAIRPFRSEVYIATKVGLREGTEPSLSREYVQRACEESLKRLGTDHIDLYQVHFDDPETPVEETVEALEGLVRAGKVRRYGLGHLSTERVELYFELGNVFSVLMELSAVARESRERLLPLCRAHSVGAIAFSVTGRGLLTRRFQERPQFEPGDIRNIDPLFQRERFQSGLRVAAKLAKLGKRYGKTPAQVAIAWVLAQPGVICALTGPSTVAHLEENVGGSGWRLAPEDLEELEAFLKQEDMWLEKEQRASVERVLQGPLPQDPSQAFTDLIYVIETALSLELTTEKEILPLFQELYGLRASLDEDAIPQLVDIQNRLGAVIKD